MDCPGNDSTNGLMVGLCDPVDNNKILSCGLDVSNVYMYLNEKDNKCVKVRDFD